MPIEPEIVIFTEYGHLGTDGGDTVIALMPEVVTPEGLRGLADDMASLVSCYVHHAEFVFTTDPEVVATFGIFPMHHGCKQCEAGVARAVEHLERRPGERMLVGRLYWADVSDRP